MPRRKSNQQTELVAFALRGIDAQISELERKRAALMGEASRRSQSRAVSTTTASTPAVEPEKKRKFSAAHLAKLRAAAQPRWSKKKGGQKQAAVKRPQATARKAAPASKPGQNSPQS